MTSPTTSSASSTVPNSGNANIDALLGGTKWGGSVGTSVVVSYSFPWANGNSAVFAGYLGRSYSDNAEPSASQRFALNATQQAAVQSALSAWGSVANISAQKITETDTSVGDIRIAFSSAASLSNWWGYAWEPDGYWPNAGDIWINANYGSDPDWAVGSSNFHSLVHEIGHALGLDHPFEGGVSLPAAYDSLKYTVMSYTDGPNSLFGKLTTNSDGSVTWQVYSITPQTPMLFDMAAIQYVYGANNGYRTGNDTYTFDPKTPILQTIWDAGGTDAISVANFNTNCVIDLNAGSFSSITILSDSPDGYNWSTPPTKATYDGTDNLCIAYGVTIENAVGGRGNDKLTGNSAINSLVGGDGNDTLSGGGGDDVLDGGLGVDYATFLDRYSDCTITVSGTTYVIRSKTQGTDTVKNIEFATFADKTVSLSASDTTPPTIAISASSSRLNASQVATITLTLSENSSNFTVADLTVLGGKISNFSGAGMNYSGTYTPDANSNAAGSVRVLNGTFSDAAGNLNGDESDSNNSVSFSIDTIAPSITKSTPASGELAASVSGDIALTFNEKIATGAGTIYLKKNSGAVVAAFDVATSASVSVSDVTLTINPSDNLVFNTTYTVEIPRGVVTDVMGNLFDKPLIFSFTTGGNHLPSGGLNVSGSLKQGQTIQVVSSVSDTDGLGAISYQWQSSLDEINWRSEATANSLALTEGLVGRKIRVLGTYTDGLGTKETVASSVTAPVLNVNDPPTGGISLAGNPLEGQTLAVVNSVQDPDGNGVVAYEWQKSTDGVNWSGLNSVTGVTYPLTESDLSLLIRVVGTYIDGHGTPEVVTSPATTKVQPIKILGTQSGETLNGTTYADVISAGEGNDTILGGYGNDSIDGGAGIDTAVFSSPMVLAGQANYVIKKLLNGSWTVAFGGAQDSLQAHPSNDGFDTLTNVERIKFADRSIALDINASAGIVAKVIGAVLGQDQVHNPSIVGIGLSYCDKGTGYSDLGLLALKAIGANKYDDIVSILWKNVIGFTASASDKAPYVAMLSNGMQPGDLVVLAADTSFNLNNINLVGLAQTGIEFANVP